MITKGTSYYSILSCVYSAIYLSASNGGAAAGGMFWQLLTEGMDSFRDWHEVVFSHNPSTASIIVDQSPKFNRIRKMYARLRNIEKWERAKDMRTLQWRAGNNGN
jgi:mannan endo-1,4-beta-mannosidase